MTRTHRGLLFIVLMAVITLPALAGTRGRVVTAPSTPAPATTPTAKFFAPTEKEAFLSDDVLAYIRPGLQLKVNSVTVGTDGKVTADLSLTDAFDQPIDRLGKTTPGAVALSYILAWYNPATRQYTSYTTRSQTSATTPSSCVIRMIDMPRRCRRSASRSRICAWMVTSSAVVGSSAISRCGSHESAIAIITR